MSAYRLIIDLANNLDIHNFRDSQAIQVIESVVLNKAFAQRNTSIFNESLGDCITNVVAEFIILINFHNTIINKLVYLINLDAI